MPERQLTIDEAAALGRRLETELGRTIVGQRAVLQEILIAFFAGGHCLLRGVPGLAKTLIIKTLARTVALSFNRIQFTPDLMPSDIVGAEVIEEDRSTGRREVRFMRGPVFAHILLADEINRTPPRTQAALLEAMQERQVTVGGVRYEAAISVGVNLTFEPEGVPRVEAFLLDFSGDIYGERIEIRFAERLRGMVAFAGVDALIERMHEDVRQARELLAGR